MSAHTTSSNSEAFVYDAVGRLAQASGPYGQFAYHHDKSGKLSSKEGVTFKNTGYQVVSGSSLNSQQVFSSSYDANGNLVSAVRNTVRPPMHSIPTFS